MLTLKRTLFVLFQQPHYFVDDTQQNPRQNIFHYDIQKPNLSKRKFSFRLNKFRIPDTFCPIIVICPLLVQLHPVTFPGFVFLFTFVLEDLIFVTHPTTLCFGHGSFSKQSKPLLFYLYSFSTCPRPSPWQGVTTDKVFIPTRGGLRVLGSTGHESTIVESEVRYTGDE